MQLQAGSKEKEAGAKKMPLSTWGYGSLGLCPKACFHHHFLQLS